MLYAWNNPSAEMTMTWGTVLESAQNHCLDSRAHRHDCPPRVPQLDESEIALGFPHFAHATGEVSAYAADETLAEFERASAEGAGPGRSVWGWRGDYRLGVVCGEVV